MKKDNPNLSIVIPCFNEAKNITVLLKQLKKIITQSKYNIEVIVIDGGSTDTTPKELKSIFKFLPKKHFKVILNQKRAGYGSDIMQALSQTRGEILAWTHADLQTDPKDVINAYEFYLKLARKNKKLFIKGVRKNRSFKEEFFSFGMQLVVWAALKTYLSDINAQPKLFSRSFYDMFLKKNYPSDFSLDLYAFYQAKMNGYIIKAIPVYFKKRLYGEAKGGGGSWQMRFKLIKRTFKYIFALRQRIYSKD